MHVVPRLAKPILAAHLPAAAALALVLIHALFYGVLHERDEGAAAHIFRLLAVAQVPPLAYFLLRCTRAHLWIAAAGVASVSAIWLCAVVVVRVFT